MTRLGVELNKATVDREKTVTVSFQLSETDLEDFKKFINKHRAHDSLPQIANLLDSPAIREVFEQQVSDDCKQEFLVAMLDNCMYNDYPYELMDVINQATA